MTTLDSLIEELRRRSAGFAYRGDTIFSGAILAIELQSWAAKLAALSPPEPTEGQVEAMAKAAFEIDWPKDDWSRFKPGDYVPERYRKIVRAALRAMPLQDHADCHGLDNERQVFFYEQDFYGLSNFSSFRVKYVGINFDTSEHAYHFQKFRPYQHEGTTEQRAVRGQIMHAPSAHEAFKIAERNKGLRRPDWDEIKVDYMREILRAKVDQHEYVRRKLLATGDRELIENSWRDDFWGWGRDRDGKNMLGKLWMEVRAELRAMVAEEGTKS